MTIATTIFSALALTSTAQAGLVQDLSFFGLTHPILTFLPRRDDVTKPDPESPMGDSRPVAGFHHQAVLHPVVVRQNQRRPFSINRDPHTEA
ncbi:hypothetical protein KX928_13205 [Roseobacter sp. YSTF-M11]|uniref:Uncharacterized protein n=1 Tax=Roseobacter insulae TaxID=2859783 RepID=A0A9X1FVG0_9RHOB|nr:hypothetical protein [Roseobacter insulae]MBW4708740.1 hypothetical protein [Roseobacter insulae]